MTPQDATEALARAEYDVDQGNQFDTVNEAREWAASVAAALAADGWSVVPRPTVAIRATHWAGFRSGEWAVIEGVEWANDRPCYRVRFPDGATDSWVMFDASDPYEFRAALGDPS